MTAAITIAAIIAAPFVLWFCVILASYADENRETATQIKYKLKSK
jgi:hypothetical protein